MKYLIFAILLIGCNQSPTKTETIIQPESEKDYTVINIIKPDFRTQDEFYASRVYIYVDDLDSTGEYYSHEFIWNKMECVEFYELNEWKRYNDQEFPDCCVLVKTSYFECSP